MSAVSRARRIGLVSRSVGPWFGRKPATARACSRPLSVRRSPTSVGIDAERGSAFDTDWPWRTRIARAMRSGFGGGAAGDDVHELLQVLGRPAFEGAVAVALVGRHHRVTVVPVELRLGVEPEQPAGALGDAGEDL